MDNITIQLDDVALFLAIGITCLAAAGVAYRYSNRTLFLVAACGSFLSVLLSRPTTRRGAAHWESAERIAFDRFLLFLLISLAGAVAAVAIARRLNWIE